MLHSDINVELIDSMGSDLTVVNAARVSFSKESSWEVEYRALPGLPVAAVIEGLREADAKLIRYLAKHGHWTPFGHITAQFRIKAPIFVARQLVKHQVGLVWNEVSRRYVNSEPEFYIPETWRASAENVKQGSSETEVIKHYTDSTGDLCHPGADLETVCDIALGVYRNMIKGGIAPEQARMVLPQNTMTEWWWTGSVAAFARVCKQRLDPHAQAETREVAEYIAEALCDRFPHSWKALMNG